MVAWRKAIGGIAERTLTIPAGPTGANSNASFPQRHQGEFMGVTPFPQPVNLPQGEIVKAHKEPDWMGMAVGGTLLAGAVLLLSGKKKAGLVVTAGATALTLLDQQEALREWWYTLPKYLDDAQRLLDQAHHTLEDLAAKRDKLRSMFNR